jgi:hypothetical protein
MKSALPPDSIVVANWSASDWFMDPTCEKKHKGYQYDALRSRLSSGTHNISAWGHNMECDAALQN